MSDGAADQFPKSLPVDDHFLLSPMLNDQKNKEKIKAMMERNDDDFENELDVPNPQEEHLNEDWHPIHANCECQASGHLAPIFP